MSSSPLTSLSRTPAQEASLVGVILMPYFLSKPSTEAITTEAQSVSGMKPILTSVFSGASEPAAHAPVRTASGTMLIRAAAPACLRKVRRGALVIGLSFIPVLHAGDPANKKRVWSRTHEALPARHPCLAANRHWPADTILECKRHANSGVGTRFNSSICF